MITKDVTTVDFIIISSFIYTSSFFFYSQKNISDSVQFDFLLVYFFLLLSLFQLFLSIFLDQVSLKAEHQAIFNVANAAIVKEKNKKRGRNKISAKLRRKQKNVVDAQSVKLKEKLQKDRDVRDAQKVGFVPRKTLAQEYGVLARFVKK